MPDYCDPIDDNARFAFEAVPERLYIIEAGKIAYRGGEGPFDYKPEEVAGWLAERFPEISPPSPPEGGGGGGRSRMPMVACVGAVVAIGAALWYRQAS